MAGDVAVEPIPDAPAAVAEVPVGGERRRLLVLADYHAGIETGLSREGVELESRADRRRERLLALLERSGADRLVVLGDLGHAIGTPGRAEREELLALFEAVAVPVTVVRGNHDGDLDDVLARVDADVTLTPGHGTRIGPLGVAHGHTWPAPTVLDAEVVCVGHEHPVVRLEDSVGGHRAERAWLRGGLDPAPFEERFDDAGVDAPTPDGDLVVFPAFNDRSGGTWVNVDDRDFLSPFLPDGLARAQAFLLDGTRLGNYRRV